MVTGLYSTAEARPAERSRRPEYFSVNPGVSSEQATIGPWESIVGNTATGIGYNQVLVGLLINQRKETERSFVSLSRKWHESTAGLSSIDRKINNEAYQAIVGLGRPVLPLILSELQKQPGHWFAALKQVSGEDPVRPENRGDIAAMRDAWLRWGKAHGLLAE